MEISMNNDKKVAVITDASTPVAEAIARRLEKQGMSVVRNYPSGKIKDKDVNHSFELSTCSEIEMRQLLDTIVADIGTITALVHTDNAIFPSSIETIAEEDFKRTLDINTKSAFITTKVFGGYMGDHGSGAIVYLSTIHGEKPTGCAFAYSVGKGAVKMLCKEMALFYGRKGVRTNILEVGLTEDQRDLLDSTISPFNYDAETKIPLKRLANAENFAGAAVFLLSEDAAFINGAELRIDGGHLLYYGDR